MLKKLLASTLAVATVATCAYVPSAFASAADKYETADMVTYAAWKLKNPDVKEAETDVKIHFAANFNGVPDKVTVKTAELGEEAVKKEIIKKLKGNGKTEYATQTETSLFRFSDLTLVKATDTEYVASMKRQIAVVYSEYNTAAVSVADTKADTLKAADLKLLGYYETADNVDTLANKTAAYADMYKLGLAPKLADNVFAGTYNLTQTASTAALFTPNYIGITKANVDHQTVNFWVPDAGTTHKAVDLIAGITGVYTGGKGNLHVELPSNDRANWDVYLTNHIKLQGWYPVIWNEPGPDKVSKDGWVFAGVTEKPAEANVPTFALICAPKTVAGAETTTEYNVAIKDENGVPSGLPFTAKFKVAGENKPYYTKDIAEIFAQSAAAEEYATVEEYLLQGAKDGLDIFRLNGAVIQYNQSSTDSTHYTVTITFQAVREDAYTVYSYAPGNKMVKTDKVYLTAAEAKANDKDLMTAVNAELLGVAAEATVADKRVVFDHATLGLAANKTLPTDNGIIYTTYKYEEAAPVLPTMADFAMATGKFNDVNYYGRAAKAGDSVRLKVSFADAEAAAAKGFELKDVTVKFNTKEAAVATDNFDFVKSAEEPYESGIANMITLGAGMNIVTATVSYKGTEIGTTEMFYAYVAE